MSYSNHSGSKGNRSGSLLMTFIEGLVILLLVALIAFIIITVSNQSALAAQAIPTALSQAQSLLPASTATLIQRFKPTPTARTFIAAPTSDLSAQITPTDPPSIIGYSAFPLDVDPLTGLKVDDITRLERRPVIVKVSNYPRTGRPHAGLSFADMVFEYYIGYDLNRFAAVYLGQDSKQVGPIRSGRLVDAQINEMYQSIFVYGDADPQIDAVILKELGPRALAEKFLPTPPKYRIGPVMETNLFVNTAEVTDYVNEQKEVSDSRRDLRGMVFGNEISINSKIGTEVGVQYGETTRGEWHYNPDKGKYLGWIEDPQGNDNLHMIPWIDRLTKEQLAFSNIIIMFATYKEYAPTKHDVLLYNNHNGKRAVFFRDGLISEGQWRTPDDGRPIQFFNTFGAPYILKPGNTWIVLAGDSSKFEEANPGDWEMLFGLP